MRRKLKQLFNKRKSEKNAVVYEAKVKKYRALAVDEQIAIRLTERMPDSEEGVITAYALEKNTKYRGIVIICSIKEDRNTSFEGVVELYDVIKFKAYKGDFTKVANTGKYLYMFKNPCKIIDIPFKVKSGFHSVDIEADMIQKYPQIVYMDKKGWQMIKRRIENGKTQKAIKV